MRYLESKYQILLRHARCANERMESHLHQVGDYLPLALAPSNPYLHEQELACARVLKLLQPTTLKGFHCTRLTDFEMDQIRSEGMQPPNRLTLVNRIRKVQLAGLIDEEIAHELISSNEAGDSCRREMIWFCFFDPYIAGQLGIERFFRYWGGEALFNSHERNKKTGIALRSIGRPCIIEADVPVSSFGECTYLPTKIIRRYLLSRGYDTNEPWDHEDKTRTPIVAESIKRFIIHGDQEFSRLTECDSWNPPLGK